MSSAYGSGEAGSGAGKTGGAGKWAILIVVLALALGYAYWRFVYYPTTPQYALREFLGAVRDRDYETVYGRLHISAPLKLVLPSAKALETVAENAGGLIPRLVSFRLGKVSQTADGASIAALLTTEAADPNGSPGPNEVTEVTIELRLTDNRWKVDAGWAMREMVRRGGSELLRSLFQ